MVYIGQFNMLDWTLLIMYTAQILKIKIKIISINVASDLITLHEISLKIIVSVFILISIISLLYKSRTPNLIL